jgi:hypothetical protein
VAAPELDVVDVERGGRWTQVLLADGAAAAQLSTGPYVALVSADLDADAGGLRAADLGPEVREIVCFDSLTEPVVTGQDFAMAALETGGFGQDFVFTVPVLEVAVDYALDALQRPDHGGWEGRSVVVVGPAPVIDRARAHLTAPG